jgi:hypothetical protein
LLITSLLDIRYKCFTARVLYHRSMGVR